MMKKLMMGLSVAMLGMVSSVSAATITSKPVNDFHGVAWGGVTIVCDGVTVESGATIESGKTVTLTASAQTSDGKAFVRWTGNVPDGQETVNPLTLMMGDGNLVLTPVYKGMWIADVSESENMTLSDTDDNWVLGILNVTSPNKIRFNNYDSGKGIRKGTGDMDLSTPIVGLDDGQRYTIYVLNCLFRHRNQGSEKQPNLTVTSIVAPHELEKFSSDFDTPYNSSITNIVLDCPNASGSLPAYLFYGGSLEGLMVKCPKITSIASRAFYDFKKAANQSIDVSDWDLSGVKELVSWYKFTDQGAITDERSAFRDVRFKGTLRLPNLEYAGTNSFLNTPYLDVVELGGNGTIRKIDAFAFRDSGVKRIVIGGSDAGWTISTNVFPLKKGTLKEVEFLGPPPGNELADGTIFDGAETAAKSCVFTVPRIEAWTSQLAGAESVDATEAAAFMDANPGVNKPLFARNFMGSVLSQYISYSPTMVSFSVADPRYGENFTFKINGETVSAENGNRYYYGETVAVTVESAETDGKTRYVRFGSDPVESMQVQAETSFVVDGRISVTNFQVWCHTEWLYVNEAGKETISDGVWTLNVTKLSDGNLSIGVGNTANSALTDKGEGILDLSTPVKDAGGNLLSITTFAESCFETSKSDSTKQRLPISQLVFPWTTEKIGNKVMRNNIIDAGSPLTTVIMVVPNCIEIGEYLFAGNANGDGHENFGTLKVVAPSLRTIPSNAFIGNWKYWNEGYVHKDTDLGAWDLSAVETMKENVFKYSNPRGVLRLPKLVTAQKGVFETSSHIEGLELGTGHEKTDRKNLTLGEQAFRNLKHLKTLTFGPYASYTVATNVANLDLSKEVDKLEIFFEGVPPTQKALDSIFLTIGTSTGAKKVTIYGSRNLQWDKMADVTLTPDEEAAKAALEATLAEDEYVIGVYVTAEIKADDGTVTKQAERKAWIVHRASEFDPKGTILIIR